MAQGLPGNDSDSGGCGGSKAGCLCDSNRGFAGVEIHKEVPLVSQFCGLQVLVVSSAHPAGGKITKPSVSHSLPVCSIP